MSEFDLEAAAQRMFGGSTPNSAPSNAQGAAQPATDEQSMADRLFGTAKPAQRANASQQDDRPVSELTEEELAQRLYGNTDPTLTHRDAVQAIVNASMQDHLHDPETAGEIAGDWAETFARHQLNATESKELADIGASVMRNPPSEATVLAWRETAIANLQTEYGVEGAGQALQDARAYVSSQPGLADLIDAYGLGAHPKLVALAAARGRALRMAGKLK